MTGIIDYGMGNIGSLVNMVERLGENTLIISDTSGVKNADKLILPGVGSFDNGIKRIKECGLWDLLNRSVLIDKIPILCICLGMQLITKRSDEGNLEGLGWIDAEAIKFTFVDKSVKVPHMGWNQVKFIKDSKLLNGIPGDPRFYFVHSYYVRCNSENDILGITNYHNDFVSVIEKGNIFATQFHPEKSHKYGLGLIKSFIELC